jgi:hypothetical protein
MDCLLSFTLSALHEWDLVKTEEKKERTNGPAVQ